MRVAEALRNAAAELADVSDTARLDAELLMAEALGVSRSDMLLRHGEAEPPALFAELIARRLRAEPVAYILGFQEFYGRRFLVTPDVLIPRADSETVIEAALDAVGEAGRVLDLGTGSGALLLTLLAERPRLSGVGIDASLGALAVAAANGARLGLADRSRFLRRDWSAADWTAGLGRFDLVIANPPYVEDTALLAPAVARFEPSKALFSGPEGLNDYRLLVPQLPQLLESGGKAVLEIGASQGISVQRIAEESGFYVEVRQDLGGRDRALILTMGLGKGPTDS